MGSRIKLVAPVGSDADCTEPELDLGLPPLMHTRKPRVRRPKNDSTLMKTVGEFHFAFNLPMATRPQSHVPEALGMLRIELLREEFEEFRDAVKREDLVGIADALGDIVYVAYGAAVTYGIDLDAILREIHRANMSKLGSDGKPVLRQDGKVLKSEGYRPPDIRGVLLDQPPLFLD